MKAIRRNLGRCMLLIVAACCLPRPCLAQGAPATTDVPPGMVSLNFPESVELKTVIDFVAKRNGINFIYDEQLAAKRVTIKALHPLPAESLTALLDSALKMNGLALVRTDVPGMLRIQQAVPLRQVALGPGESVLTQNANQPVLPVTRVFQPAHASPTRLEQLLKDFLSNPGANVMALPDLNLLVVTDYAPDMGRLEEIMALLDQPGRAATTRFLTLTHVEATTVTQLATQLLQSQGKVRGQGEEHASLLADDRANQVAVIGTPSQVSEAIMLIESLDRPLGLETRIYHFLVASPEQVDRLTQRLVGEVAAKRLYRAVADRDSNMLIVTATPAIHEQVEALRRSLDKPAGDTQSPIRFYKLEHAKAKDVLQTLQELESERGLGEVSMDGLAAPEEPSGDLAIRGPTEAQVNRDASSEQAVRSEPEPAGPDDEAADGTRPPRRNRVARLRNARVLADEPTNAIIVVARPSMHAVYERLIRQLDVRRPQVLVEATVIAIDTTGDFALGVEIHSKTGVNGGDLLNFTQFGLTKQGSIPGSLTLSPGTGFTGALLNADVAEFVIRALQSDSRARVVSRPSVLINDNATGVLASEAEEPFASVNASSTVATTSLGGFVSAGTKVEIKPQISQGNYLKLEYNITLSSFTDNGSASLPPARQTNNIQSEATIPDGHTIVVGGLTRESVTRNVDRVPLLGSIPGIEYLFSSRSTAKQKTTLFVFIRAAIMRDDQFADLKLVSGTASEDADMPSDFPQSDPLDIR